MSARVEKLISEYPQMVSQKKCLAYQVAHFRGLSPEDVITSMYTAHHAHEAADRFCGAYCRGQETG